MLKRSNLVLLFVLLMLICAIQNVRATLTLTIDPASQAVYQRNAAFYTVRLSAGATNATYALTLTGLPSNASYTFSSPMISGSSGSSLITIQTSMGTQLYCPGNYQFTITATNTAVSSDNASITGSLIVNQVGQALVVSVSTDHSTYAVGDTVVISIASNRPAEGILTVSPPTGSPSSYPYRLAMPSTTKNIIATLSGTWTVAFRADDYCSGSHYAAAHFDVLPTSTNTTTTNISTTTIAYTSMITGTATKEITNTTTMLIVLAETGTSTVTGIITSTSTSTQSTSYTTTLPQSAAATTTTITSVQNPLLEIGLAATLIISTLVTWIRLARGTSPREPIICSKCGFKNPSTAPSFCVKCGQPLKRGRPP